MFSTDVCGGHAVNFSIDKTRADGASYIYNNKPEERAARMVLTIDIGNTNIVLGGYENGALGFCTRISTDKSLEADQYALELSGILNLYKVAGENIEGAIISSVVPQITDTVARALRMFAGVEPLKLTQELPTGVGVNIDTPSELGADLLAGAIAAKALYPLPAIVIDMGTATKITAVDEQGTVQGVSIMPGVFISLDALVNGTSLLKGIATNAPVRAIGPQKTPWKACRAAWYSVRQACWTAWSSASKPSSAPQKRWWLPAVRRALLCRTAGTACNMCPHSFWTAFMPCTAAHTRPCKKRA